MRERDTDDRKNERNRLSQQRHRKELFWQITVPVLIGAAILVALALWATLLNDGEISRWADISLIGIVAPLIFLLLIMFASLIAGVYATVKVIQALPSTAYRLHRSLIRVSAAVIQLNDRLIEPALRLRTFSASLKALNRQLSRRRSEDS